MCAGIGRTARIVSATFVLQRIHPVHQEFIIQLLNVVLISAIEVGLHLAALAQNEQRADNLYIRQLAIAVLLLTAALLIAVRIGSRSSRSRLVVIDLRSCNRKSV